MSLDGDGLAENLDGVGHDQLDDDEIVADIDNDL